jgi:hypothetical protein
MFLTLFGTLFYSLGPFGFTIVALTFLAVVLALRRLYEFTIEMSAVKIIMKVNAVIVVLSILSEVIMGISSQNLTSYFGFGLFFVLFGTIGFFYMLKDNNNPLANRLNNYSYHLDFCEKRALEAIEYWKTKCELVSELGSQIHNEKKLTSLRKFFLHRENLSVKVEQLEGELMMKSSHRRTQFRRLEKLEDE